MYILFLRKWNQSIHFVESNICFKWLGNFFWIMFLSRERWLVCFFSTVLDKNRKSLTHLLDSHLRLSCNVYGCGNTNLNSNWPQVFGKHENATHSPLQADFSSCTQVYLVHERWFMYIHQLQNGSPGGTERIHWSILQQDICLLSWCLELKSSKWRSAPLIIPSTVNPDHGRIRIGNPHEICN